MKKKRERERDRHKKQQEGRIKINGKGDEETWLYFRFAICMRKWLAELYYRTGRMIKKKKKGASGMRLTTLTQRYTTTFISSVSPLRITLSARLSISFYSPPPFYDYNRKRGWEDSLVSFRCCIMLLPLAAWTKLYREAGIHSGPPPTVDSIYSLLLMWRCT